LCLSLAQIESLECRRLLSAGGYSLSTLASFAAAGLKNPSQTIVSDSQGNVYGVAKGGANGDGAVWELTKNSSTITVLASFSGDNGSSPNGGLVIDSQNTLYGTCASGGANNDGTVWKFTQNSGAISVLGSFSTATAAGPSGQIYVDGSGDIFGTTQGNPEAQAGSIWEYNASNQTLTALVLFTAGSDNGANPHGGLISDGNGNFYGTTFNGGTFDDGVVWKYHLGDSNVTVLTDFDGSTNGGNPEGGLARDSAGDLFGTSQGNVNTSTDSNVWELPANSNTITSFGFFAQHSPIFFGGAPAGAVILDSNGNLFGTASFGGATNQGEVFEVPDATSSPGAGTLKTVFSFSFAGAHDPTSSVVLDSQGNIFGTTTLGGTKNNGTIFKLLAPGNIPSTHLAFTTQPTNTQANGVFSGNVIVTIEGAGNQTAAFDDSAVTIALAKGTDALGGTTTVNAVDGVATFTGLSLGSTGTFTIKATDGSLTSATSHPFMVPLTPQMSIAQEPGDVAAGAKMTMPVAVNLKDQFGNLLTTNHSVMKLSIASGATGGKLLGATAVVTGGVATFKSLVIDKAGAYTLNISDGKISGLTTTAFNVSAAAASKMVFLTQPASTTANTPFGVQVELVDAFGNVAVADTSQVTLALKVHPASAVLAGTLTEPVSNGIATFTGLSIGTTGNNSLVASDSNALKPIISKVFMITG
jgi:uncharacterized repeat protein (TIGR03803 family)